MSAVVTVNPATGVRLAEYPAFSDADVDAALDRAADAPVGWAELSFADRAAVLRRTAEVLRAPGRTSPSSSPARWASRWPRRAPRWRSARRRARLLRRARRGLPRRRAGGHLRRPQLDRLRAGRRRARRHAVELPAVAGAAVRRPGAHGRQRRVLKHSPNTTGCALAVQRVLTEAGAPGLATALVVAEPDVPAVTHAADRDPRIGAVTITGSEQTRADPVGSAAGDAIKKSVLELGGSDPFVVLADADLPRVAAMATRGRFLNARQSCISPKRFVVDASVAEEFTRLLVAEVEKLTVGDPEAPVPTSARWPARTCRGVCTVRSRPRSPRAPACSPAAAGWPGRELLRADRPDRRRAGPSRPTTRIFGPVATVIVADGDDDASGSPTTPASASARASGPPTPSAGSPSPAASARARCSSTRSSPPTSGCRSAAPGPAATGGSWPRPASASSSTSAPGGSWTSPPSPHRRPNEHLPPRRDARRRHRARDRPGLRARRRRRARRAGPVAWHELPLGASAIETHGSAMRHDRGAGRARRLAARVRTTAPPLSRAVPVAAEPQRVLRKQFDLYANIRPARASRSGTSIAPDPTW